MIQGGTRTKGFEKAGKPNNPLVSIITVVLNGDKHIEETIKSILNQSYWNIEYIVVDGESKDQTLAIIQKYEDQIAYWQSAKDGGLYFAMNKGISLAKGELIGMVNADDFLNTDAIQLIVDAYLKTNADVVHGDMLLLNNDKQLHMKPEPVKMMQQPSIFHPTCFVKKEVYDRIGAFDTQYRISSDYDFLLRCIRANYKFEYVPHIISNFRVGGMSDSCASNIEGYKIMKVHKTGYHQAVAWRAMKCYVKTFLKKMINLGSSK